LNISSKTVSLWPEGCENIVDSEQGPPRMAFFIPETTSDTPRAAVIVLPGGGYSGLAPHEGAPFAKLFAEHGMVSAVCYYRRGQNCWPRAYADAARGIRMMRAMAGELDVNVNRVGLLGFSAGGHNAVTVATHPERYHDPHDDWVGIHSARPDRLLLGYPVVSFVDHAHEGSCQNLLGKDATDEQRRAFSGELNVTANTPPMFLFHTSDDGGVPMENSLNLALACRRAGVPVEVHSYETGNHGVGLALDNPKLRSWSQLMIDWLADWTTE
jgi:acetyl esterase/lipase